MIPVYKKELKQYLYSVTGSIFISVNLFVLGLYFLAGNLLGMTPSLSPVISGVLFILMLMVLFGEVPGTPVQFATRTTTSFAYGEDGLLTKMQTQCEDRTETEFYEYDDKKRKTLASLFVEYNDNDAYYKETSYNYEDDVDFTKITEYNSYRTKKTYTYDKSGNIQTVKEYEIRYKDGVHTDALCSVTEYAYEL